MGVRDGSVRQPRAGRMKFAATSTRSPPARTAGSRRMASSVCGQASTRQMPGRASSWRGGGRERNCAEQDSRKSPGRSRRAAGASDPDQLTLPSVRQRIQHGLRKQGARERNDIIAPEIGKADVDEPPTARTRCRAGTPQTIRLRPCRSVRHHPARIEEHVAVSRKLDPPDGPAALLRASARIAEKGHELRSRGWCGPQHPRQSRTIHQHVVVELGSPRPQHALGDRHAIRRRQRVGDLRHGRPSRREKHRGCENHSMHVSAPEPGLT